MPFEVNTLGEMILTVEDMNKKKSLCAPESFPKNEISTSRP